MAEDPDGRLIRIRFSRPNEFGVLDHTVFAEGRETRNAVRVVPMEPARRSGSRF